jgi:hypothetical protein
LDDFWRMELKRLARFMIDRLLVLIILR